MDLIAILLTLLVGVPVAIATNLATPHVGRWLERLSARRLARQTQKARDERGRALYWLDHPDEFTQHILLMVMRTLFHLGFLSGIILAALIPAPWRVPITAETQETVRPWIALMVNVLMFVVLTRVAVNFLRVVREAIDVSVLRIEGVTPMRREGDPRR